MNEYDIKWFASLPFAGTILDVGSYNVNGSVREVLPVTVGADLRSGPCVDLVLDALELVAHFGTSSFDNVVSANTLEHCKDWKQVIANMHGVCRENGIIAVCTCGKQKPRHDYPSDFWRFTVDELERAFTGNKVISRYSEQGGRWVGIAIRKTANFTPIDFDVMRVP